MFSQLRLFGRRRAAPISLSADDFAGCRCVGPVTLVRPQAEKCRRPRASGRAGGAETTGGRASERTMPRKPTLCTKNHSHGPRKPSGRTAPISTSYMKLFPCAAPTRPVPRKPGGCTRIHNRRPTNLTPCTSRRQLETAIVRPLHRKLVQRPDFLGASWAELVQSFGFLGKDRRSEVQPAAFLSIDSEPLVQRANFLGRGRPNVVQKTELLGIGRYGPIASPTARPSTNDNKQREEHRGEAFPKVELWPR